MAKKILIIEDEKALVKSLELALKDNYKVLTAASGKEGLQKAKKEKPDLILLDILLPDKNGTEVLKAIKTDEDIEDIPVIVLTNLGDRITISKIFEAGGKEYIVKSDWGLFEIAKKIKASLP